MGGEMISERASDLIFYQPLESPLILEYPLDVL